MPCYKRKRSAKEDSDDRQTANQRVTRQLYPIPE